MGVYKENPIKIWMIWRYLYSRKSPYDIYIYIHIYKYIYIFIYIHTQNLQYSTRQLGTVGKFHGDITQREIIGCREPTQWYVSENGRWVLQMAIHSREILGYSTLSQSQNAQTCLVARWLEKHPVTNETPRSLSLQASSGRPQACCGVEPEMLSSHFSPPIESSKVVNFSSCLGHNLGTMWNLMNGVQDRKDFERPGYTEGLQQIAQI